MYIFLFMSDLRNELDNDKNVLTMHTHIPNVASLQ